MMVFITHLGLLRGLFSLSLKQLWLIHLSERPTCSRFFLRLDSGLYGLLGLYDCGLWTNSFRWPIIPSSSDRDCSDTVNVLSSQLLAVCWLFLAVKGLIHDMRSTGGKKSVMSISLFSGWSFPHPVIARFVRVGLIIIFFGRHGIH